MTEVARVTRGGVVEGRHHGSVVALRADGSVGLWVGTPDQPMLGRSSLKPLQAVGMLEAGLQVEPDELALVCSSHSGQPMHLAVVQRILAGAGLDASVLDNTPGLPLDDSARTELICRGEGPSRLAQNCSGKHAGMVATCVVNDWLVSGYRDPDHPLQRSIRSTVERLTGERVAVTVVDGCGAPLFAVSLVGLARAFARLATAPEGSPEAACRSAMRAYPELVGGTGRDVSRLLAELPGAVAKDGAEGVYAAALSDGRAVAVKIDDGGERARLPVLVAGLRALGADAPVLDELARHPVLGHGVPVGEVSATIG